MPRLAPSWTLVLVALSGCVGPLSSDFERPEVRLAGVGLGQPGLFEQELILSLRLENPNDYDIAVEQLSFDLEVNGEHFTDGRTTQNFTLPALGEATVPVSVDVPTKDFLERAMRLGSEGRFDYRLTGEAELDHVLAQTVPFEWQGRLELPRIAAADSAET
jgi:LEA14-like dessication related protein